MKGDADSEDEDEKSKQVQKQTKGKNKSQQKKKHLDEDIENGYSEDNAITLGNLFNFILYIQ